MVPRTGAAREEGSIGSQEFLGPLSIDEWARIESGMQALNELDRLAKSVPQAVATKLAELAEFVPHLASAIWRIKLYADTSVDLEKQLQAAHGYVVLYTNPRGSTSYGEEFGNLIHHNYPGQDYDDLMSAVDAVVARGWADPEQLYVTGGSGGGVLTAWIVGKTDRFRAAVSAKPVINWYSFALTSDGYNFFHLYWFPGFPWDEPEAYLKRSPLSLVGNVTTPTMLLTGERDLRTPMAESEQFYQALKLRRVPAALVRIPGASHGIARRPSQLIAKVQHVLAWFERYAPTEATAD